MRNKLLTDLLLSMFSADELRRLVRWNFAALAPHLPAGTASPASLAAAVVDSLQENGFIDADLWRILKLERPRRTAEIEQVQRHWDAEMSPPPPTTSLPSSVPTRASTFAYDVFLAHASPDKPTAERLFDQLITHPGRLSVFLDSRSLELGQAWDTIIPASLRKSQLIVVMVSEKVETAWYARDEIAEAIALTRRHDTTQRVVPIFLDGRPGLESRIPYGVRLLHGLVLPEVGLEDAAKQIGNLAVKLRG